MFNLPFVLPSADYRWWGEFVFYSVKNSIVLHSQHLYLILKDYLLYSCPPLHRTPNLFFKGVFQRFLRGKRFGLAQWQQEAYKRVVQMSGRNTKV